MPTADAGFEGGVPNLTPQQALAQFGPTLHVRVGFDWVFEPGYSFFPQLPEDLLPALVDTGAGESCIDSVLAQEMDLPVVDHDTIAGVGGEFETDIYLAQIYIPSLNMTLYGEFAAVHLISSGQPYSALLGRTFLQNVTMSYEGRTGVVLISNDDSSDPDPQTGSNP